MPLAPLPVEIQVGTAAAWTMGPLMQSYRGAELPNELTEDLSP
jgi:hypothetical protein